MEPHKITRFLKLRGVVKFLELCEIIRPLVLLGIVGFLGLCVCVGLLKLRGVDECLNHHGVVSDIWNSVKSSDFLDSVSCGILSTP